MFFFVSFSFNFRQKSLVSSVLVNRTISYLGYTSKPCHLCIALVLSNKKTSGYFSTDFLLHLSPHMRMFIVNCPSYKPELFGSEKLLTMLQTKKISYRALQENTVIKQQQKQWQ